MGDYFPSSIPSFWPYCGECFADHGRPIPERDFVADFKSRNWSSFLQLGVESYSDKELIRLV